MNMLMLLSKIVFNVRIFKTNKIVELSNVIHVVILT